MDSILLSCGGARNDDLPDFGLKSPELRDRSLIEEDSTDQAIRKGFLFGALGGEGNEGGLNLLMHTSRQSSLHTEPGAAKDEAVSHSLIKGDAIGDSSSLIIAREKSLH